MALFGYSRSLCDTRKVTAEPKAKAASPRGLEGVIAASTAICKVEDNSLIYRGYPIEELATKAEYEEVAYLLLNGELPNKIQLRDFKAELAKHRPLSPLLRDILKETSDEQSTLSVAQRSEPWCVQHPFVHARVRGRAGRRRRSCRQRSG